MTLFWLSAAWLVGVGIAPAAPFTALNWIALAAMSAVFCLRLHRHPAPRWIFGLFLVLALGAANGAEGSTPAESDLVRYHDLGRPVTVRGTVADFPERTESRTRLLVDVQTVALARNDSRTASGKLLVWADRWTDWRYGDRIEISGRLEDPPEFETFSYRAYLARRGVYSVMLAERGRQIEHASANLFLDLLFRFRAQGLATVHRLFPEPEASLLAGILLGVESGIPETVQAAFDATGTTHIIAISGFNISIIAGIFVQWTGRWFGARRGAWAAGAAISAYTLLVGADAAVVRAAIMAGLALVARRVGRQSDGMAALGASAVLMTLHRPTILWDAGFQLSFAATLGLLRFAEPLQAAFEKTVSGRLRMKPEAASKIARLLQDVVFVTLSAQLTTLPLTIYHFQRVSLAAPLANFAILPLQPAVMILGGIATLAGMAWLPLGIPLAWIAWPFPALTIRIVETFAEQRWTSLALSDVGWPSLLGMYAVIFGAALLGKLGGRGSIQLPRLPVPSTLGLAGLALTAALAWEAVGVRPDNLLRLTVLDVGSGEALLLRTPTGRNLLINGGASSLRLGEALDRRLSPLQRDLDWVILLRGDEETIGGLAGLIERYPLGSALTAARPESPAYERLLQEVQGAGRPVVGVRPGQRLILGPEAWLEVLDRDEDGTVVAVRAGQARFLVASRETAGWTADLRSRGVAGGFTAALLPAGGDSQATSSTDLAWLNPAAGLLSVEAGNQKGLPSPRLLDELSGRSILRTDQHGWIELSTDGQQLWVEVERTPAQP